MNITQFLDPDMNPRSFDKVEHAAAGFVLCILLDLFLVCGVALALVAYTAVVWELAQTDTAYNLKDSSGRRYAGQPGFGFGILDVLFTIGGGLLYCAIRLVL